MEQAGCYLRVVFCPLSALLRASPGCEMFPASEADGAIKGQQLRFILKTFYCAEKGDAASLKKLNLGKSKVTICHLFCPGRGKKESKGRRGEEGI